MPLREYRCDACSHRFEVIQKMSDPPLEACPKCGGVVRKLQSAPAFHLKGSGWYLTDYAKKDQSTAKTEDESKGAKSGADAGDAKAGESKTDTAKTAEKSSGSGDTTSASTSSPASNAPAKAPAKDS